MSEEGFSKTEQPTDSRIKKAVEQGDIAQSKELASGLIIVVGACWVGFAGSEVWALLSTIMRRGLGMAELDAADAIIVRYPDNLVVEALTLLAMLLAGVWLAAAAAAALVGGLGLRPAAAAPKFSRINPVSGFRRLFGVTGLGETIRSLVRMIGLGLVGWWLIMAQIDGAGGTAGQSPADQWAVVVRFLFMLSLTYLFLSAGDAGFHWLSRKKRLMMSRQEVEDERKQSDGSPELKARQRQRRVELLSPSVRKVIETATVVMVNPTHFAVALRYEVGADEAPVVVARGRSELAHAIIEQARQGKVPLLSCPPLTRSLYFTSKVNNFIHPDLYRAVAMVIAHVFAIRRDGVDTPLSEHMLAMHIPESLRFDAQGRRGT